MPITIYVREDDAIQYSPSQAKYYRLKPHFDKQMVGTMEPSYTEEALVTGEPVLLCAQNIHHCHTVIIKDRTYDNYFMLHVSPQSLRKPYDAITRKTFFASGLGQFGLFGMDMDTLFTDLKKPAYIDLDPYYYKDMELGTRHDSQLEVIIVANNVHWNEEEVQANILKVVQERVAGVVVRHNIIINAALEHAYYYDVEFNPQTEVLTVLSRNGWYSEPYERAFKNNQHRFAEQQLPVEHQFALRLRLTALLGEGQELQEHLFKLLAKDITLDQLILSPAASVIAFYKRKHDELVLLSKEIEGLIQQTNVPVFDLGSPLLYQSYRLMGLLQVALNNDTASVEYFIMAANYASAMRKAEYDNDKITYSIFAGAASERIGNMQQAYVYYKISAEQEYDLDGIDAKLRLARVAAKIEGKELEALESAIKAQEELLILMAEFQQDEFPDKKFILHMIERRQKDCQKQIDSLAEHYPQLHECNERIEFTYTH